MKKYIIISFIKLSAIILFARKTNYHLQQKIQDLVKGWNGDIGTRSRWKPSL